MIKCELSSDATEIEIAFDLDPVWNQTVRAIPGRRWSRSRSCWVVPNTKQNVIKIGQLFGKDNCKFSEALVLYYKPDATLQELKTASNPRRRWANKPDTSEFDTCPEVIALSQEVKLRNYSYKTFKNYKSAVVALLIFHQKKPLDTLTLVELKQFFLHLVEKRKLSGSSLNVYINAIKFYYEKVLGRDKVYFDIPMPKREKKLPQVLSVAEVQRILEVTRTPKFKTIFQILYASGMRLNEVTMLKATDIDFDRMVIRIDQGKGKKDRYVMLSAKMATILKAYMTAHPSNYVFTNPDTQEPISERVVQKIFKSALVFAKVNKKVGVHVLRHSFATHLFERGENILVIKELLGHTDINTTMRYLHLSKDKINTARSPIDDLL